MYRVYIQILLRLYIRKLFIEMNEMNEMNEIYEMNEMNKIYEMNEWNEKNI